MFQDERISAYLDGQLPPDERTQFEDELARNGELRQVVEELRGLHDSLQELPRHRLNDDFALQVLRRAERVMLSDSHSVGTDSNGSVANGSAANGSAANGSAANGSAADDSHVVRAGADNSFQDARKSRRPWIWAAIVVAAAIAIMVFNPPEKKPAEVAVRDSAPASRTPEQDRMAHSLPEGVVAEPAAARDRNQSLEEKLYAKDRNSAVATDGERQLRKRIDDRALDPGTADGLTPTSSFGNRRATEKEAARADKAAKAPQTPPSQDRLGELSSGRGGLDLRSEKANGAVAGGGVSPGRDFEFRSNLEQPADAPTNGPAEGRPAGKPQSTAGPVDHLATSKEAAPVDVMFGETAHGQESGTALGLGRAIAARSLSYEKSSSGDMFVAEVATEAGVSPEAFQQLLDKRGIAVDSSPAANLALISAVRSASAGSVSASAVGSGNVSTANVSASSGVSGNGSAAKTAEGLFSAPSVDKDGDVAGNPKTAGPTSNYAAGRPNSALGATSPGLAPKPADAGHAPKTPSADDESLEVVYVVGTREQVMGLFNDLSGKPAQFRTLALSELTQEAAEAREADAKAGGDRLTLDDKTNKAAPDKSGTRLERFADGNKDSSPASEAFAAPVPFSPPAAPLAPAPAPSVPPALPPVAPLAKTEDQPASALDGRFDEKSGKKSIPAIAGGPVAGASAPAGANETTAKLPAPKPPAAPQPAAQQPLAQQSAAKQHAAPRSVATQPATPQPAAIDAAVPAPVVEEFKVEQEKADLAVPKSETARLAATTDSDSLAEPSEQSRGSSWASPVRSLPKDIEDDLRQALAGRQNQLNGRNLQLKLREREVESVDDSRPDRGKSTDKPKFGDDVQFRQKADVNAKGLQREGAAGGDQAASNQAASNQAASDQVQAVFVFRLARGKASTTAGTAAATPSKPVAAPTGVTSSHAAPSPAETPSTAPGKASK